MSGNDSNQTAPAPSPDTGDGVSNGLRFRAVFPPVEVAPQKMPGQDASDKPQTETDNLFKGMSFNDHARYKITRIILLTFAGFIGATLLGWIFLACVEVWSKSAGSLTKPFFELAQYIITSLVGVVSVATGFYFGKSKD